jgi:hypothetical protein
MPGCFLWRADRKERHDVLRLVKIGFQLVAKRRCRPSTSLSCFRVRASRACRRETGQREGLVRAHVEGIPPDPHRQVGDDSRRDGGLLVVALSVLPYLYPPLFSRLSFDQFHRDSFSRQWSLRAP